MYRAPRGGGMCILSAGRPLSTTGDEVLGVVAVAEVLLSVHKQTQQEDLV
jgi:hypothetical protein